LKQLPCPRKPGKAGVGAPLRCGVQQVAPALDPCVVRFIAARLHSVAGRSRRAPSAPTVQAIDNATRTQEDTMKTTTITSRLQSLAAAALMTVLTLTAIDHLAAPASADGVLATARTAAPRA
jgi:hypothetical protein